MPGAHGATAGSVSATLVATGAGLRLTTADGEVSCHGWGTAWQPGMAEGASDCVVVFTRSSARRGGTTPVDVAVTYDVSWSATDSTSGTMDAVTMSNTTDIAVGEIQTVNVPNPDH